MAPLIVEISELLISKGSYRRALLPLRVSDIEFIFDAILVGPEEADSLVLVIDLQEIASSAIRRRIKGLVTLLDRMQSKRSVSAIFVIRSDFKLELEELEKFCHIVFVRPDVQLERCLRTLLPLELPTEAPTAQESTSSSLQKHLGSLAQQPFALELVSAAEKSVEEIQGLVRNKIDSILSSLESPTRDK